MGNYGGQRRSLFTTAVINVLPRHKASDLKDLESAIQAEMKSLHAEAAAKQHCQVEAGVEITVAVMVGEETGRMGESMQQISKAYETKGKAAMQGLALLAGFSVWGLVGLFIIFMIFRVAFFYFGLLEDISNW